MTRNMIDRWIDQSCNTHNLDKRSKSLLMKYLKNTLQVIVNECEKQMDMRNSNCKYIPLTIVNSICEQFLLAPKSFAHSGLLNDLMEVKKEKLRNIYEKSVPECSEVV